MRRRPRRLVSVAHSYVVALNRRLAHEMARVGRGAWEVTAVAPASYAGDLRPVTLEAFPGELCRVEAVPVRLSARNHVMSYGPRLRAVLGDRWDVVHCWEEPFIVAGYQVASLTHSDAPLVFSTFQNLTKRYPPPFSWIERYAMRRSAAWIAGGHTVEQALAARPGYRSRPHRVIPLGVDIDHFRADAAMCAATRRRLGWDEGGPPVVGYLGRFVAAKGVGLLMRALDQVAAPWRALVVGGGPMEAELRAWAARHGDRVRVVTGVGHDHVPAYLNAMDVLAAPSQTTPQWREQLGRMLIEAFACGVPVVASDSGEIPHVVGDAGVIVGEADLAGWTRTLGMLVEDPGRRADLVARGVDRARMEYAWPVVARRHLEFFDELLGQRAAGA